jgi:hypothetical protein
MALMDVTANPGKEHPAAPYSGAAPLTATGKTAK